MYDEKLAGESYGRGEEVTSSSSVQQQPSGDVLRPPGLRISLPASRNAWVGRPAALTTMQCRGRVSAVFGLSLSLF